MVKVAIQVRLSVEERDRIRANARAAGMGVSAFVRSRALEAALGSPVDALTSVPGAEPASPRASEPAPVAPFDVRPDPVDGFGFVAERPVSAFKCPAGHGVVPGAGPKGRCFCNRPVVPVG